MWQIDKHERMCENAELIREIAHQLHIMRPTAGESVFIPDFPLEAVASLNSALAANYLMSVYTKADAVYGGAGVRIYNITEMRVIKTEQGLMSISDKLVYDLLGIVLAHKKFYAVGEKVQICDKTAPPPNNAREIGRNTAFLFLSEGGAPYRGKMTAPEYMADDNVDSYAAANGDMFWLLPDNTIVAAKDAPQENARRVAQHVYLAYCYAQQEKAPNKAAILDDL